MKPAVLLIIALAFVPLAVAETPEFHAASGAGNFGYDYREGCALEGNAIACAAHAGNSDYLGEAIASGRDAYGVEFSAKADAEGEVSILRAAFTFDHGAVSQGVKGNGRDSGAFANSVQAVLTEGGSGDNWSASIWQVKEGQRTQLAALVNTGVDDGTFNTFRLNVDLFTETAQLHGPSGLLLEAALPETHDEFAGQWFVALSSDDGCFGTGSGCEATTRISVSGTSTTIYNMAPEPPEWGDVAATTSSVVPAGQSEGIIGTLINGDDSTVVLHYTINGVANTATPSQNGDEYTGLVPGQPEGTRVVAWLVATDSRDQRAESDEVRWTVGEAPPTKQTRTTGGGGVEDDDVKDQDFLLMAGLSFIAGLGVFILLRRQSKRLAIGILVLGVAGAALLLMAWQGVVLHPAYLLAVPLGFGAYVVVRK